ncbi:MAG: acyl-CoA dehydratase activase [Deltaproteobacteria bacterium]|nr:acyl-CoA dehydratase activase [Deltaproteobacteria bacterium]
MKVKVGVDLGSAAIKVVLTDGAAILWRGQTPTAPGQEILAKKVLKKGLSELGLTESAVTKVVATGYGKGLCGLAEERVDEITANATGLYRLSQGQGRLIVNIGGQDLKIIHLDERGRVADFKMNDKCAAGTGRFFELAARLLDVPLADFGALSEKASSVVTLNSTCVVFAESEMVSLMATGVTAGDIASALQTSVARRVASLVGSANLGAGVWLDGGPALNKGLVKALADELLAEVFVLPEPQYTVAFGAAITV